MLTLHGLTADNDGTQLDKKVYNIVVLGNTGVGKSSLLNMLAGEEDLFEVGDKATSQTHVASSKVHRFMGKSDALNLRLVDTQGLSDSGGDIKDMENIKNMVEFIKKLERVDLFIICFDGMNPRYTAYTQSTVSLFRNIFPDFIFHSVIVFNKWLTADRSKSVALKNEYQAIFKDDYGIESIPCFFIDSFFNRKMLRENDNGEQSVRYLHPNIQERTMSQIVEMMNYLVLKRSVCDVREIVPSDTEKAALIRDKEAVQLEMNRKRVEFEKQMRWLKEENDRKLVEARELSAREMQELRRQMERDASQRSGIFTNIVDYIFVAGLSNLFGSVFTLLF